MTIRELREKYLRFFESKGHTLFPSGSLIPIDVTGRLDESLLFNGAGMVQFKPYFRGIAEPTNKRLTTAQKCVRTGDIEVVGDLTHLTFFEMMGNFSFGDYFKNQAIEFSWEFLTSPEWLGLDNKRLAFTVFEEDNEAYNEWEQCLRSAGIKPEERIFRLGEETNYWPAGSFSAGPPGPCGPNSEMFYWTPTEEPPPSSPYNREDFLRDEAAGKWLEIWNDVFIQFEWQGRLRTPDRPSEGYEKDGMPPLPFQSVDTGMGLERTIAAINGVKSVYDNDAFEPIFRKLTEVSGGQVVYGQDPQKDIAMRIIADHIRTAVFCIADGILPGNTGRGYVLRRLIRRAVLKGQRVLGFNKPFFHRVYEGVVDAMGNHYTELIERRETIIETLKNEEALFRRTVTAGTALLLEELENLSGTVLPGATAFQLYDTFGFPLEVTVEIAEEAGIQVDVEGYEQALKQAQERSRAVGASETVYGGVAVGIQILVTDENGKPTPTKFVGYSQLAVETTIVGAVPNLDDEGRSTGEFVLALESTPFYAESGGQASDKGVITGNGFQLEVLDVSKQEGVFVHLVKPIVYGPLGSLSGLVKDDAQKALTEKLFRESVVAQIDEDRRRRIMRNHTATHLLHAALRETLGKHVTQAGSYVGPDRLRFDFNHGKGMTPEEIARVEYRVNITALDNTEVVTYVDIPIAEAKSRGAMALFGEKYGDSVRMIEVGDFSRELCGGTHVRSTGEIGLFKIVSESSAASGVRRIEAVTGEGAYEWVLHLTQRVMEAASLLKSSPGDLVPAVERALENQKELGRRLERLRTQAASGSSAETLNVEGIELALQKLTEGEQKDATLVVDRLAENQPGRVALVGLSSEGKVFIAAKVGSAAQAKGAHAGNIVREIAKITGGGGGGRPDFATAGGRNPDKLDEALKSAPEILREMLKP